MLVVVLAVLVLPSWTATSIGTLRENTRLCLYHTHTNERIDIVYRRGDTYIPSAVQRLDEFLRDHRTGDVHALIRAFSTCSTILLWPSAGPTLKSTSCAATAPRGATSSFAGRLLGVAEHSLHMEGEAIDIRIPGVRLHCCAMPPWLCIGEELATIRSPHSFTSTWACSLLVIGLASV